jgi:opacity protein-like surface antigen
MLTPAQFVSEIGAGWFSASDETIFQLHADDSEKRILSKSTDLGAMLSAAGYPDYVNDPDYIEMNAINGRYLRVQGREHLGNVHEANEALGDMFKSHSHDTPTFPHATSGVGIQSNNGYEVQLGYHGTYATGGIETRPVSIVHTLMIKVNKVL